MINWNTKEAKAFYENLVAVTSEGATWNQKNGQFVISHKAKTFTVVKQTIYAGCQEMRKADKLAIEKFTGYKYVVGKK
jgi:hypothetical protein